MVKLSIVERIDQWAMQDGERICYQEHAQNYTYSDLKKDSDALAKIIQNRWQNPLPIIVFGGLDYEMLVSFLACAKTGHAYIPLDLYTPVERIELITQVADYAGILAIAEWPIANEAKEIISYPDAYEQTADVVDLGQCVKGRDNFYIIFTSGTTGIPKGVQISHDNLASFTDWLVTDFQFPESARFLSQAPYSFDLSVMDIYPALLSGGCLVPLKKKIVGDFKQLFLELPKLALDVWVSTPSFLDICLMDAAFTAEKLPTIQCFLFCGEELTHGTAEKLQQRFPSATIYNTYGPTEATVAVTQVKITKEILEKYPRLPIGYAKADTTITVIDERNQALPAEQVGEILISGPSVSKGYLNNPEKTELAFTKYNGQPAYRTGDLGSLEQGLLFYKGRKDFQVKLHGYRIELEDIEHHLMAVDYVKLATVVPKYQEEKVQQLIAYVVPNEHTFEKEYQLTKAIKEELKKTLMDYMIPQKFVYVERLELTQNGKVNRKKLRDEVNPE